ncbi:MAG: class I SAM-dependent methyltransferase, partial [Candidatus Aenigmarchaeota archaeon]|nr:class I SAM-dependent methyltransferase [Candidatus Aenigmarchaeota archaeon]
MEPREFHWPASTIFRLVTANLNPIYEYIGEKMEIPKHAKSLLEIGGGNGREAIALIKLNPQLSKVVTTDISGAMVDQARENIKRNNLGRIMRAEINDAHNLNYDDGSFDAVISFGSLHHFSNPVKVLHECNRVLKPNGYFGIIDLCNKPSYREVLKKMKYPIGA